MILVKLIVDINDELVMLIYASLSEVASKKYDQKEIDELIKLHDEQYLKAKIINDHFYGAYLNDRLVGCGCINEQGFITTIFTHPAYLRLKVATTIMETLLNDSYVINLNKVMLKASYDGYFLYQKLGFKEIEDCFDNHGLIMMEYSW